MPFRTRPADLLVLRRKPRITGWLSLGWRVAAVASLLGLLIAEALVLPFFGAGFFGASAGTDPVALHAPLAIGSVAYGLLFSRARANLQVGAWGRRGRRRATSR